MEIDEPSLSKKDTKSTKITSNGKKTIQKTKSERGKKRERSQDTSDSSKKRKRIVVLESSDESDTEAQSPNLFESSELEETVTPPKERSPSPPAVQVIAGKRKVRKTIDEKYMDEDGYLVTKKVQVMESASEDDEPVPVPVKPATKKVLPPSKTTAKTKKPGNKQTTLTSFFTKK